MTAIGSDLKSPIKQFQNSKINTLQTQFVDAPLLNFTQNKTNSLYNTNNSMDCSAVAPSNNTPRYKADSPEDKNGSIEFSRQRGTGDCWLLSGINSLSYTEEGRKLINEALEYQDGQTIVHFKGIGDYVVTDAELADVRKQADEKSSEYSNGDDDMLIFELAIEKFLDDCASNKILVSKDAHEEIFCNINNIKATEVGNSSTEGGHSSVVFNLLSGKKTEHIRNPENINKTLDRFQANNGKDFVMSATGKEGKLSGIFELADGTTAIMPLNHAYGIKSVSDTTVVITDPWDSSKNIEITRESFCKNLILQTCDLSENEEDVQYFNHLSEYTDKKLSQEELEILKSLSDYDRHCAIKIFEENPKANKETVRRILNMQDYNFQFILEDEKPEKKLKEYCKDLGNHKICSDKTGLFKTTDYNKLVKYLKLTQDELGEAGLKRIANRNLLYNPFIPQKLSAEDIYNLAKISDENWLKTLETLENNPEMSASEVLAQLNKQ